MHFNRIPLALAALLTSGATPALAQRPMVSAAISDVRYEVTANATTTGRRQIHVRMTFTVNGNEPVLLSLPAWTPGSYEISNFARFVMGFDPQSQGKPLR